MEERTKPKLFESDSELEALLAAFDEARIPGEAWTHREHLAVAALYVLQQRGLDDIRTGIQRLNEANGVPQTRTGGYHETITCAWMRLIADRLKNSPFEGRTAAVNDILETFGDKRFLLNYYSRTHISSPEARYNWVEPDLRPLPS